MLENLAPGVTNGNKVVVSLGSDPSSTAGNAASSAFILSSLPGLGWTFQSVNGDAAISAFLSGGASGAGIIMLDSGGINIGGGLDSAERTALATNAAAINSFLGAGGGLFSQANGYAWLSALLPAVTTPPPGDKVLR